MPLERSVHNVACKGCGGPLSCGADQTMIVETPIVRDGYGSEGERDEGGWCGDCVEEWNWRLAVRL